ncbi:hypothetical protein SUGI_0080400 [Cryptomeria japonica]|nr:hypothetical protein SUGI_0080400 [Cryptomeria japonica]
MEEPVITIEGKMVGTCAPHYTYTVVYVKAVSKSVDFYSKDFCITVRRLDHSRRWGELESGITTIAFTPTQQHEMQITEKGEEHDRLYDLQRNKLELCLKYHDINAAFEVITFKKLIFEMVFYFSGVLGEMMALDFGGFQSEGKMFEVQEVNVEMVKDRREKIK